MVELDEVSFSGGGGVHVIDGIAAVEVAVAATSSAF